MRKTIDAIRVGMSTIERKPRQLVNHDQGGEGDADAQYERAVSANEEVFEGVRVRWRYWVTIAVVTLRFDECDEPGLCASDERALRTGLDRTRGRDVRRTTTAIALEDSIQANMTAVTNLGGSSEVIGSSRGL